MLRAEKLSPWTRCAYSKALRQILRWLSETCGAPRLDKQIRRYPTPAPRNTTIPYTDRARILAAAPDHLRLWLLLCSDLAIRSGTAANIGPQHYDRAQRTLTFTTKWQEKLSLPTTTEIDVLISLCEFTDSTSFVRQLWARRRQRHGDLNNTNSLRKHFRQLCVNFSIPGKVRPHDLRRTAACAIYDHTRDLRAVQALLGHKHLESTLHYLDHHLTKVSRANLELIKSPEWRKEQSA
jgi:integrase